MSSNKADEFADLEAKIAHVIAYAKAHGKTAKQTLPPIVRLMIALDLAERGPVSTIAAVRGLLEQIERHFPQSTVQVDLLETEPCGSA